MVMARPQEWSEVAQSAQEDFPPVELFPFSTNNQKKDWKEGEEVKSGSVTHNPFSSQPQAYFFM